MKLQYLSIAALFFSSITFAESNPPKDVVVQQQSSSDTSNNFTYPAVTHTEEDAIVNDVVFFYTDDMLDYFDNDAEMMVNYVQAQVDANNESFRRQDIALRRKIAGIVRFPSDANYRDTLEQAARIKALQRDYTNPDYGFQYYYDVSYVVALSRYHEDIVENLGAGWLSSKYSWMSPTSQAGVERTFMHELGHNDGLTHSKDDVDEYGQYLISNYAVGVKCDSYASVMKNGQGYRSEFYFSSPLVTSDKGTECGEHGVEDAARAYRQSVDYGIKQQIGPFWNYKPSREATGTVALSLPSTLVTEGEGLTVEVYWDGAEQGDSVRVLTRKGTADKSDFLSTLRSVYYNGRDEVSSFVISTKDDDTFEINEKFSVELIHPHGVSIADNAASKEVVVQSDEAGNAGKFSFKNTAISIQEGSSESITLLRENGSDGKFTVRVESLNGSAEENDYFAIDKDLTFDEGETSKKLSVRALNDSIDESNESFKLTITGEDELIGQPNQMTITITSNKTKSTTPDSEKSGGGSIGGFLLLLGITLLARRRF